MRVGGVLFSAESASRAGVGCCTPPLASSFGLSFASSNFRSNDASMLRGAGIDVAAVVLGTSERGVKNRTPKQTPA